MDCAIANPKAKPGKTTTIISLDGQKAEV